MSYEDIIHLPHPVSPRRRRMSMIDRAAQFSPFAALTGFDAVIQESGRRTDSQIDLAADGTAMLDEKLRLLCEHLSERPEITVTHFRPDLHKSGGSYEKLTARAVRLDALNETLWLNDGTAIPFSRIFDIEADFLP